LVLLKGCSVDEPLSSLKCVESGMMDLKAKHKTMRCHATVFVVDGCSLLLWLTLMGLDQNAFLIQKTQKLADPPKTSFAKFKR
jgi:hypothetical protein